MQRAATWLIWQSVGFLYARTMSKPMLVHRTIRLLLLDYLAAGANHPPNARRLLIDARAIYEKTTVSRAIGLSA